ncbi:probable sodium/metabolite cotransporter BASS4, chloroplastic isoform X2 [Cornus florida]|uniref:probable sodium/metabolite cotransporter BASS4, chloroplastic isoform X2 n=1 Tax=Cornus florida TaxID=4283 RepID=UPI0028966AD6|nr:probable sodium/metabolite cotransporter BASS4, chloroplastic isoform X2 [Cornus florida]
MATAGTLQTLIFITPTNVTFSNRHRNAYFRINHVSLSRRSANFNHNSSLLRKTHPISRRIRASERPHKLGSDGDQSPQVSGSSMDLKWAKPLLKFASNNFLPLALVSGVTLGLANPSLGCLADSFSLSKFSTFGIFILSGLTLRSEEIGAAAEAWPVGIFGLGSILFFTPFFSRLILLLQLQPQEFVTGLALFSCMPTTLSSGVALTRLAGGNSALALAMTVISNLLGILIVPFSVSKFLAAGVGISFPTEQLFRSLLLTLLVPLILGKVFRESFKGVADFADHNRKLLSVMSAVLLSLVPWIQVSRSRSLLLMVKPAVFLVAVGMGAYVFHCEFLTFEKSSIELTVSLMLIL